MKKKNILLILFTTLLVSSCIVKSLKPFYTVETLAYDSSILGTWKDNEGKFWKVLSLKDVIKEDSLFFDRETDKFNLENDDKEIKKSSNFKSLANNSNDKNTDLQKIFQNAYLIKYKDVEKKEESFIVVPFIINSIVFLDFCPLSVDVFDGNVSDFAAMHFVGIHTLAKLDKMGAGYEISWLSESKIEKLFRQNKIRIAHEKVGIDNEEILLTASSEELQKFISKYIDSSDAEKWETPVKRILKRTK